MQTEIDNEIKMWVKYLCLQNNKKIMTVERRDLTAHL